MPTFFFDVFDGRGVVRDEVGAELADVHEAALEAAALLPDFARDCQPDAHSQDFAAAVRDEGGNVVYRAVLVLRGKLTSTGYTTHGIDFSGRRYGVQGAVAAIEERKDLERKVSENVRKLMATVESSRKVFEGSRKAIEESRKAVEASRALRDWRSRKGG